MRKVSEKLFMVMTLLLCVVLFLEHFTGPIWHVVFGVILIIMTVGHLCRQMVKLRYQKPSVRLVDQVLFVSLSLEVTVSYSWVS